MSLSDSRRKLCGRRHLSRALFIAIVQLRLPCSHVDWLKRVDRRPSPMTANRHANLHSKLVQFAQCRTTAPAGSRHWRVILRTTVMGRQHQFAAYESCRSGCLARCDPASFRFEAYSGRLVRQRVNVWCQRQRPQACQSSAAVISLKETRAKRLRRIKKGHFVVAYVFFLIEQFLQCFAIFDACIQRKRQQNTRLRCTVVTTHHGTSFI